MQNIIDGADPEGEKKMRLTPVGGEFRDAATEAGFLAHQASETFRHARLLLIISAIVNSLFFASDWRFAGTPHFWVAISARSVVVGAAMLCLALLHRYRDPPVLERVMIGWMAVTALAVGVLVTSHSDIALFVTMLLPSIYYLAVPVSFRWTLLCGAGCSVVMLLGFSLDHETPSVMAGLTLAMLVLNCTLTILVARSNRLSRLAWLATQAERRAKEKLAASQMVLEKLFAACPVPLMVISPENGRILKFNDSWLEHIGAASGAPSPLVTTHGYFARDCDSELIMQLLGREGSIHDLEVETKRTDGSTRTVILRANSLDGPDSRQTICGMFDISERKAAELSLERIASTDMLTGLPNRLSFFTAAHAEMTRASRMGSTLSLLMIDLDHFKQVNDSFGHHGGDQALRAFAGVCRKVLAGKDIIGRLGGEEFAVLLPHADMDQARDVAERIRRAVEDIRLAGNLSGLRITSSIGVARVRPGERNPDGALARADAALYLAKKQGRNCVVAGSDLVPSRLADGRA
jgi:diguanylate cyclase (GGDEF)-like protein